MSRPDTESAAGELLTFEGVDASEAVAGAGSLVGVDLSLRPGGLVLVRVERGLAATTLGDAAVGLLPLDGGRVCFEGRAWSDESGLQSVARRRRIGRVYERTEWVSNLNVDENVILRACHTSSRPEREIVEEALELARQFGLSDLTSKRPNLVGSRELRACALVRALLGSPILLVLERPLRDGAGHLLAPLAREVRRARERGAGVLWMTPEEAVLESGELEPDLRYGLREGALRAL